MIVKNINDLAKENANFRKVMYTGKHSQLVLMSIPVGGDIGEEVHEDVDQILIFVEGDAEVILDGVSQQVGEGDVVCVTAGVRHNAINTGQVDLKLHTVYSPPEHADGTVHATKVEAQRAEHE